MAVGTKDLLNLSVLQDSEMSLSLQLLLCPARMLWRGCLLFSHPLLHHSTERVKPSAYHRTSLFHQFVQAPTVFVCSATPPADNSIEQCTLNDSVIKHAHHVTADTEGPEPSQEEETALLYTASMLADHSSLLSSNNNIMEGSILPRAWISTLLKQFGINLTENGTKSSLTKILKCPLRSLESYS